MQVIDGLSTKARTATADHGAMLTRLGSQQYHETPRDTPASGTWSRPSGGGHLTNMPATRTKYANNNKTASNKYKHQKNKTLQTKNISVRVRVS